VRLARIDDLGPGAAKYLMAVLDESKDAGFRERMGTALVRMESPDALPFFEKCLKGGDRMSAEQACEGC